MKRLVHRRSRAQARLIICERCQSDFVNPVLWHEHGETHWWIRLRCGECGLVREVTVTNEDAKRFDRELDRGMKMIRASAARLDRERMTADLDILRVALARDLIEPSDFRP